MKTLAILALLATLAASFQPPPLSAFVSPPPPVVHAPPARPTAPAPTAEPPRHERHERREAALVTVTVEAINWLDVDYQVGPQ